MLWVLCSNPAWREQERCDPGSSGPSRPGCQSELAGGSEPVPYRDLTTQTMTGVGPEVCIGRDSRVHQPAAPEPRYACTGADILWCVDHSVHRVLKCNALKRLLAVVLL